jgi:hypothetical protein
MRLTAEQPVLPTPQELREEAARYREDARSATSPQIKRQLTACALMLAQAAEAIEDHARLEQFRAGTRRQNLLATLDRPARQTLEMVLSHGTAESATQEQIARWRLRAEELRTAADQFQIPSAAAGLRMAADNYETLAERAEAMLKGNGAYSNQIR